MGAVKLNFQVTLADFTCGKCGGTYALSERYIDLKHEQGGYWHCPYCQVSWGYGTSENDRLKAELKKEKLRKHRALDDANKERQRADKEAAKAEVEKKTKQRIKTRVANGVCPCCNRHFNNLFQHMHNQHPDFVSTNTSLKIIREDIGMSQNKLAKALNIPASYISTFENNKYVPKWARKIIEEWIAESR